MAPRKQSYLCSFTTGGLLVNECRQVIEVFARTKDWSATLLEVRSKNLLQTRTMATTDKRFREVRRRLESLNECQQDLLLRGSHDEQIAMVWLGICKSYRIIKEFAIEFVRDRFLTLQLTLNTTDFEKFLDSKSIWDASLEALTDSTRTKLKRVVTQMMKEAGIVANGLIQPCVLSRATVTALMSDREPLYQVFPVSDRDFARLAG